MAKQAGGSKLTGRFDDLCFYRMEGHYYVRMKSSLTGKRFYRDAAFEGSRRSASRFGEGNRVASEVYRMVSKEKRVYSLFCFLKRRAVLLLKEGKAICLVKEMLLDYVGSFAMATRLKPTRIGVSPSCRRIQRQSVDRCIALTKGREKRCMPLRMPDKRKEMIVVFTDGKAAEVRDG